MASENICIEFKNADTKKTKPASTDTDHSTAHFPPIIIGPALSRQPPLSPLRCSDHKLWRKGGSESTLGHVITSHPLTILMFGSYIYPMCTEMVFTLKALENAPEIIYVPVFTYRENAMMVRRDFFNNHGDWWTMGFQTLGAVEAAYVCGVAVLPTLVVLDCQGVVISSCGQMDLEKWGDSAVVAWSKSSS